MVFLTDHFQHSLTAAESGELRASMSCPGTHPAWDFSILACVHVHGMRSGAPQLRIICIPQSQAQSMGLHSVVHVNFCHMV